MCYVADLISIAPPLREDGEMDILFVRKSTGSYRSVKEEQKPKNRRNNCWNDTSRRAIGQSVAWNMSENLGGGAYTRRMVTISNRDYPEEGRSKRVHQLQNNSTHQPRMQSYAEGPIGKAQSANGAVTWSRHRQGSEVIAVRSSKSWSWDWWSRRLRGTA